MPNVVIQEGTKNIPDPKAMVEYGLTEYDSEFCFYFFFGLICFFYFFKFQLRLLRLWTILLKQLQRI